MSRKVNPLSGRRPTVLLAEDDADDRQLTREAFEAIERPSDLRCVEDGVELLDYLFRRGRYQDPSLAPRPDLLLLDFNMPRKDGREALREIKADQSLQSIRVVVLTTSRAEEDIRTAYELSATSFISKPSSYQGLMDAVGTIARYWLEIVELPPSANGAHAP